MNEKSIFRSAGLMAAGVISVVGVPTAWGQTSFRGTWADAIHAGFKSDGEIEQLVGHAVQGNYNAVIAEVLAYHDNAGGAHGAYWTSAYVPKAPDASGSDPLDYLCQRAHDQGLEVHAWLVPYRVCEGDTPNWPPSGNSTLAAHPEWIAVPRADRGTGPKPVQPDPGKPSTWYYMLDPGSPAVQNYLLDIVRELVTHYPIDGINWDYIRYTQTDGGYPADNNYTDSSLKRFQRIYNRSDVPTIDDTDWSNFRRRTIDELVRRCRAEIPGMPSSRQPLRFSADVVAAGNYTGSFTSSTAYIYFQNWKYWMDMAWLDATIPMNYKREHCSSEAQWYRNWVTAAVSWKNGRHVYCGHAAYLNTMPNSTTQMDYALDHNADGIASYSYYATRVTEEVCESPAVDPWVNDWGWYSYVAATIFPTPITTPGMPWRSSAIATEGTVWGQIYNRTTSLWVEDASVTIGSRPVSKTDGNGYYVVTLLPATATGTNYSVSVTKSGLPSGSYSYGLAVAGEVRRYDVTLGASAARIGINGNESSLLLTREVAQQGSLPGETFTAGAMLWPTSGSLNYRITDNASWLSVTPTHGTSNGEADTITISYDTNALDPGEYTGVITVSDPGAVVSQRTVTVNLTVLPPPIPGDFDGDYDVDQNDMARMQVCLSGSTVPQDDPNCQDAKLDGDSDVDQDDMQRFIGCLSGPGVMGNSNCLNP
jgi:uncharacterized lipoprotein YddW (UPF0748 family)